MSLPLIILGGGGHGRSLADALQAGHHPVLGYLDPQDGGVLLPGIGYLGDDAALADHTPDSVLLVNGLGSVGPTAPRQRLFDDLCRRGYRFAEVRHPAAVVSAAHGRLGQGAQLLAGAVVGPGVGLGDNVLINTRAVVEHDCTVGSHTHVASGAILCGGCQVGAGVHIGAGAVLIQNLIIGSGAIIAAGAVVTENVGPLTLVTGVPGKAKRALNEKDMAGDHPRH